MRVSCRKSRSLRYVFSWVVLNWIFQKMQMYKLHKKMLSLRCVFAWIFPWVIFEKMQIHKLYNMVSLQCVFTSVFSASILQKMQIHRLHKKLISPQFVSLSFQGVSFRKCRLKNFTRKCFLSSVRCHVLFPLRTLWKSWSKDLTQKWFLSSVCSHVFNWNLTKTLVEGCFSPVCVHICLS